VLEPQSTLLFILLILGFAGLMYWMVRSRHIAVKVLAAVLGFALAMQVGILAVNKYFDYYPTWGAAITDLTGSGSNVAQVSDTKLVGGQFGKAIVPTPVNRALAEVQGFTFQVMLTGKLSHISRLGLVYLPPQYFQAAYSNYPFPVIELIHGQPGTPEDWIDVAGVTAALDQLVNQGLARPAVLVMPDANGGQRISLQCLNVHKGPQDMTYLAQDVPADVTAMLGDRIDPPGLAWGIAGYSEGGYCAANIALHFRRSYGFAGVLSGYFSPLPTDLLANGKAVDPFANRKQLFANAPLSEVRSLNPGEVIPQFWLGAGANAPSDVQAADYFAQLLALHQVVPPVQTSPGGHSMGVWRAQIPPMLEWMTSNLTSAAANLRRIASLASHHHHPACRTTGPGKGRLLASRTPDEDQRAGPTPAHDRFPPYLCQHKPVKGSPVKHH
jgi:enterochelin esterase-like enzyme